MDKKTRFVILTEGRTGKSHLVSILNKHPKLEVLDEKLTTLVSKGAIGQLDWLNEVFYVFKNTKEVVGIATKLRSIIDAKSFMQWIIQNNVKVIYMQRRDHLRLGLSVYRAQLLNKKSKTYNARTKEEILSEASYIDPSVLHHHLTRRLAFEAQLVSFMNEIRVHVPIIDIHYEDLLVDENYVLNLIYSFLKVEPIFDLKSDYYKNTSDNLFESISNLDELKEIYRGTYLENFFPIEISQNQKLEGKKKP